jgi:demethylmenaquinone methyltransferase / 2-methoxy-6-polyprenyl-1,4-benzoquinol methylase
MLSSPRVLSLPSIADKPRFVAAMFGRIASRYDLMNTLMTGGRDAAWRRLVADGLGAPRQVLDIGTGTARLAATIARRLPGSQVVGVDFSEPMLRAGTERVPLLAADALRLPFADGSFDAITSAFLLRNLADMRAGLAEQARVVRPGGLVVVLETTPGPSGLLRPLFRLYFRGVVPLLGRLVAGDASAYTYLPESSLAFLEPEHLAEVMREFGLAVVSIRRQGFGCVAITRARRIEQE